MASQVVNGKAFEYAIANEYYKYLNKFKNKKNQLSINMYI